LHHSYHHQTEDVDLEKQNGESMRLQLPKSTQEFHCTHSPFSCQLHFVQGKGVFARGDNNFLSLRKFPPLAAKIDNGCGKIFRCRPSSCHERARPGIERANFSFNDFGRLNQSILPSWRVSFGA
jgi:hypothetical protein